MTDECKDHAEKLEQKITPYLAGGGIAIGGTVGAIIGVPVAAATGTVGAVAGGVVGIVGAVATGHPNYMLPAAAAGVVIGGVGGAVAPVVVSGTVGAAIGGAVGYGMTHVAGWVDYGVCTLEHAHDPNMHLEPLPSPSTPAIIVPKKGQSPG